MRLIAPSPVSHPWLLYRLSSHAKFGNRIALLKKHCMLSSLTDIGGRLYSKCNLHPG